MADRLKAAVVGIGSMGSNHARIIAQSPSIDLIGVADSDDRAAASVAATFQSTAYSSVTNLIASGPPDFIIIAVPTEHHFEIASLAIEAGCHVLVEKPIASNTEEGRKLIDLAAAKNVKLSVGHVERFNPAIRALKARLDLNKAGRIFQIVVRRLGPLPDRKNDVGVALDLATHDVDILRYLIGSEIESSRSEVYRHIHRNEDLIAALVRFKNGVIGILQENWLSPTKLRDITINGERGMFVANLMNQELQFFINSSMSYDGNISDVDGMSVGNCIHYHFIQEEPLRLQLEAFEQAIRNGAPPVVSGEDGNIAIQLAQDLVDQANSS